MATTKEEANRMAQSNLSADYFALIADIESGIRRMLPGDTVSARGGQYTPEVREKVANIYRKAGWSVDTSGYWMVLS